MSHVAGSTQRLRLAAAGAIAGVLLGAAACTEADPVQPAADVHEAEAAAAANGWVGVYDGSGSGTDRGTPFDADSVVLRIAFDADSIALTSCPTCVTVELEPWFVRGNLVMPAASDAVLRYERDGVVRLLSLQRFSGGGGISNVLLANVRHELPPSAGATLLLLADFSLRAR